MIKINIPGKGMVELSNLVLDFNGTVATDGKLITAVGERLNELSKDLNIYVITADTNESVRQECIDLPVSIHIIGDQDQEGEKKRFIESLSKGVVVIGNGRNDVQMFLESTLAFAVIGDEGCCTGTLLKSDIVVRHINDALDLLLKPHRLIATLRN